MRSRNIVIAGLLAAAAVRSPAEVMPLADAAALFGARNSAWQAALSPSGRRLVFLSAGPGGATYAKLLDLETRKIDVVIGSDGKSESLDWCNFASETQLVCRYGGNAPYNDLMLGFSRLASVAIDGKGIKPLGAKSTAYDAYIRQNDGAILDWLPAEDGAVLMARTYVPQIDLLETRISDEQEGLGIVRIDLATGKAKAIEPPRKKVSHYLTDGRGTVRIMAIEEETGTGQLTGITRFRYRAAGSREWADLGQYDGRDGSGMWPLAIDGAANGVYFSQKTNGRDAIYRMPLDGSGTRTSIASHDKVDIDGVVRIAPGQPVVGYSFTDDRSRTVYFDPDYKKLAASLSRALPATPLINFASASRDGKTMLIHASSDQDPGSYYILDRASKKMEPVLLSREQLEGTPLAPVVSISFRAADGTAIPAYLTMSKDGAAKGRAAIVLPHGGPSSRDEWGFDWFAQFLASRGYAVIQPNYGGSSGYGDEFLGENAFRDWRIAMSDIEAAGQLLVTQGIADPQRLAIIGWSYGGYAALQSAALDPGRYKAVVAIAPVTDLAALKREAQGFTNARLTRLFIGSGNHLRLGSPLLGAGRIKAPVLLVHGDLDANVRVAHSIKMAAALRKGGAPVELLRFKELEHQLDDSKARTEMLRKIGELLERTIGR